MKKNKKLLKILPLNSIKIYAMKTSILSIGN